MYEEYMAEKLQEQDRERVRRMAREPGLVEQGVRMAWRGVRVPLRGLGHGLVGGGRLLLRLTQSTSKSEASSAEALPADSSLSHRQWRYSTNE